MCQNTFKRTEREIRITALMLIITKRIFQFPVIKMLINKFDFGKNYNNYLTAILQIV